MKERGLPLRQTLIGHLGSWKKTYVERRGLLHSVKNNMVGS
jgi:hypothetical protein